MHFKLVDTLHNKNVSLRKMTYDWELVLFIYGNLSLHNKMSTKKDVEEIGTRTDVVDRFSGAILLLAEVAVHLFDKLRRPSLEQLDLV